MKNPIKMLAAQVVRMAAAIAPPEAVQKYLGPRWEPSNISASATVSAVQEAIRSAENGDPTSLFRFYRDSLLGDEHVGGEFNKRKLAVLGQTLNVVPADKENEEDVKAAAACRQAIVDCENWSDGLSAMLDSALWPVSVCETIYKAGETEAEYELTEGPSRTGQTEGNEENKGKKAKKDKKTLPLQYTFKRFEPVNPMLFCYRHAYFVGGVGIGTATPVQLNPARMPGLPANPYEVDVNEWEPWLRLWPTDERGRIIYDASRASKLEQTRHVVHRGHLLTQFRDNWGGPMRAILFWWLLRGLGRDWFARFMERYGSPFPVAKTKVEDAQSVAFLRDAFSLASKIGGLIIGEDDQVELQTAVVDGGAVGHDVWHNVCNNAISRAITGNSSSGQARASGLGGGLNSGEAKDKEYIREDIRMFDQHRLAETLIRQPFKNFLAFNGLQGKVRVTWGGLSDDDAAAFAMLLKTLSDAGWEPTEDAEITMQERLGMPVQRKEMPEPLMGPGNGKKDFTGGPSRTGQEGNKEVETLSARNAIGQLIMFSAGHEHDDPMDPIVARRIEALTAAYKGAMAPFRQVILSSSSREECLAELKRTYRDWKPGRLEAELEEALQIAAAAGATEDRNLNRR